MWLIRKYKYYNKVHNLNMFNTCWKKDVDKWEVFKWIVLPLTQHPKWQVARDNHPSFHPSPPSFSLNSIKYPNPTAQRGTLQLTHTSHTIPHKAHQNQLLFLSLPPYFPQQSLMTLILERDGKRKKAFYERKKEGEEKRKSCPIRNIRH